MFEIPTDVSGFFYIYNTKTKIMETSGNLGGKIITGLAVLGFLILMILKLTGHDIFLGIVIYAILVCFILFYFNE